MEEDDRGIELYAGGVPLGGQEELVLHPAEGPHAHSLSGPNSPGAGVWLQHGLAVRQRERLPARLRLAHPGPRVRLRHGRVRVPVGATVPGGANLLLRRPEEEACDGKYDQTHQHYQPNHGLASHVRVSAAPRRRVREQDVAAVRVGVVVVRAPLSASCFHSTARGSCGQPRHVWGKFGVPETAGRLAEIRLMVQGGRVHGAWVHGAFYNSG
mmetsp:Transcript_23469/g.65741  ORF Transcript_23469/g.65741 Transcript_23469/m.65741 type:complete len:212 (+) Transcript_23469:800-1435(+)